jgi:GT2 family glycosyltransferase
MKPFEKNLTFVIVSFNSNHIIDKCIKSIDSKFKIIVVENSNNYLIKTYLEKKFSNVSVFISRQNLGYGRGNNLGIQKVRTKYAFILNPDAALKKKCLNEMYMASLLLKDQFTILAPNMINNYGYFSRNKVNQGSEILEVDYVKGFAILLNLKKIKFKNIFDRKFFLFLEEIDLCKRIKNIKGKIYVVMKSKVSHVAKKSSTGSLSIELCRNWHWMWSLFYFNKKHFGRFVGYKNTISFLLSSFFKLLFNIIFFKKRKLLIHAYRIHGLINSYLGSSSWLRPNNS